MFRHGSNGFRPSSFSLISLPATSSLVWLDMRLCHAFEHAPRHVLWTCVYRTCVVDVCLQMCVVDVCLQMCVVDVCLQMCVVDVCL